MFSQFFHSPLLDQSCIDKEIHAVDSEFSKNLNIDARRNFEMLKVLAHEESPFKKFGIGNLDTLQKEGIYDRLNEYYNENYRYLLLFPVNI